MTKLLLLVPALALIGATLPWRRTRLLSSDELLDRIPADRFKGLEDYLGEWDWPLEQFWADSGGFRGTYDRFCHMMLIVRVLQLQRKAGTISQREATQMFNKAILQVWFSAWVPIESFFCALSSRLPRMAALAAMRCHYQLTLAAFTACSSDNTHISATRLYQIL